MLNYDVLAMISAADTLENSAPEKSIKLLEEGLKLDEWLIANDVSQNRILLHKCNKMQILKRKRELSDAEREILSELLDLDNATVSIKAGIYLLLDNIEEFNRCYANMTKDEQLSFSKYPIGRFASSIPQHHK